MNFILSALVFVSCMTRHDIGVRVSRAVELQDSGASNSRGDKCGYFSCTGSILMNRRVLGLECPCEH